MKITLFRRVVSFTGLALAAGTVAASAQNATVVTNAITDSTIQYSATAGTGFTNYVSGYDKVKYSATTPCKSYFKFDFTGQNPNTNYGLKISLPSANANNGYTHVLVWALNQAYPSFTTNNPSLIWSSAQANNTVSTANDLLTTGPNTASLVTDFIDNGGTGSSGVTVPPPWGQYLINNQVVLVLTATNDVSTGTTANGARFAMASTVTPPAATFQPLTPGTLPPTITAFGNLTVKSTVSSGLIPFTVGDPLDPAATLTNITISLGNTNVTLTTSNIVAGSGGTRTLSFTPLNNLAPGTTASVTVTVSVTDSSGNSASSSFQLTVPPFISLPYVLSGTNVNYIPPTNRIGAGAITIPFQIVDTNVAASSLVVTGAVVALDGNGNPLTTNLSSLSFTSTTGIAPNTNNCTITINAIGSGVGIVTLNVIDPANALTNTLKLAVMVLPDSSYALCDMMHYQPSTSYSSSSGHSDLVNVSGGIWASRTVSGSVNLITTLTPSSGGVVPVGVPLIRGTASGNQNQMRLAGAPYTAGSHKVLYASVLATWADVSLYGANAAYPGNSTGGFVEFAADGSSTGVAMAQVCTITNAANTTTNDGLFYLALYNGTNSPSINTSYSETIPNYNTSGVIPNSTPDNIVVSYDVDSGVSTLWINQSSSTGTRVTLQDVAVTNLANVNYLVLRQNAGMGNILIQSAAVKVVNKPFPTITGIIKSGNTVTISYTDTAGAGQSANQQVWSSALVNGTYSQVASGVTITDLGGGNYSAAITGQTGQTEFYQIKETGTAPSVSFPF